MAQMEIVDIETVADKYMAVSGLPTSCKTHAKAVAKLALDLMEIKHTIEDEDSRQVELTIGIHSGEVVAGVIGNRTPRFCLFGNIVNLTSRVETTALTNRVNISEDTYQWLTRCDHNFDRDFVFYYRGPVTVKGQVKPIRIWLLDRAGSAKPLPSLNVTQAQDK